jgi:hypothetical protein
MVVSCGRSAKHTPSKSSMTFLRRAMVIVTSSEPRNWKQRKGFCRLGTLQKWKDHGTYRKQWVVVVQSDSYELLWLFRLNSSVVSWVTKHIKHCQSLHGVTRGSLDSYFFRWSLVLEG